MSRGHVYGDGITGDPWHRCQRCDCETRCSRLSWQNGLLLCPECIDNPYAWTRDSLIADILGDGSPEEAQVAEVLKGHGNDPEPPQP